MKNDISLYIKDSITESQIEELAKVLRGEQYNEKMFDAVSESRFEYLFYNALRHTAPVNESTKNIIDCIRDAYNGDEVDEGVIGATVGTLLGATIGPRIGQAICNVLGITKGPLYDLFCSRLVTTAIALKLGARA